MRRRRAVAFQLTNILRDVKEDAERGRIYLPLDLLEEFGVSVDRVKMLAGGAAMLCLTSGLCCSRWGLRRRDIIVRRTGCCR